MSNRIIVVLWLLLLNSLGVRAEYFRNLNVSDGLSQPSVMAIAQDGLGRMWFGTLEGINVYDGKSLRYMKGRMVSGKDTLWMGNEISFLASDAQGDIYCVSDGNLFGYDIRTSELKQYNHTNHTDALVSFENEIWYACRDSLFLYDTQRKEISLFSTLPPYRVNTLLADEATVLVGTINGLYVLDRKRGTLKGHLLAGKDIYHLFKSSKKELWVSLRTEGLYRGTIEGGMEQVPYMSGTNSGLISRRVRQIAEDEEQNIWFGTFLGLQKYDSRKGTYSVIQIPQYVGGLTHPSIFSLYKDRQGILWVGSYYGGVNYFRPNAEGVIHYDFQGYNAPFLYHSYIGEIVKDKQGNLWFGTDGGGMSCVSSDWKLLHHFSDVSPHSLLSNNIKSISYDSLRNCLFVGTHLGGLSRYDLTGKKFHHYLEHRAAGAVTPGDIIYHTRMWRGDLYLSSKEGMFRLDSNDNQFVPLLGLSGIYVDFDIDEQGVLYLMQGHHLIISSVWGDPKQDHILHLDAYSGGLSGIQATENGVYICTLGAGLLFYDKKTEQITQYTSQNSGLPSDYCYKSKETVDRKLIVTGDQGITLFNPEEQTFVTFKQYEYFPDANIIRECGVYVSSDNSIYVGDTKGVTFLHEADFHSDLQKKASVYFSSLYVNNRLITPLTSDGILSQSLPFTKELHLEANQNNILVQFSNTDYTNEHTFQGFEYKLEGQDKDWIFTPTSEARYTNLSPGTYTLLVRMAHQRWQEPARLSVYIAVPWYISWWACAIYVTSILLITGYYLQNRAAKRALALSLEKTKFEKEHAEQVNHDKLVFFTNISHEFRTPLTLIASHVDQLLQNPNLPSLIYNNVNSI